MNLYLKLHEITHKVKSLQEEHKKGVPYPVITFNEVNSKIRKLLEEYKIMIIPSVVEHTKEGNFTSVKVSADFINVDNPSEKITVTSYGTGVDNSDKGVGKAISYANKYILMKVFMFNIGKDEESELTNEPTKLGTKENDI